MSPELAGGFFTAEPLQKPPNLGINLLKETNHDGVITDLEPHILDVKSSGLRKHHYEQSSWRGWNSS